MARADYEAAVAAMDAATTKLGDNVTTMSAAVSAASQKFDDLKNSISTGMTQQEVDAAKAAIDAETTKLDAVSTALDASAAALGQLGVDPANPVPTPVDPVSFA